MASVLHSVYSTYNYYFNEYNDPRIQHLPLMNKPWFMLQMMTVYLLFVKVIGRKIMQNRKPLNLTKVINYYNLCQIALNLFCAYYSLKYSYMQKGYNYTCQVPPYNDYTYAGLKLVTMSYIYFLLKILDLMDTVFFVLRKKDSQVTFLHTYHHVLMVLAAFAHIKYYSGAGQCLLLGIINCLVHAIMYSYYFLTSFKPELKQSLWWKKHITQVQMLQFAILIIHFILPLFRECSFPKSLLLLLTVQHVFMISLFGDFYYKTYIKKKTIKDVPKDLNDN
ncbi:unnamed protein product [Diamesa serratosioi]